MVDDLMAMVGARVSAMRAIRGMSQQEIATAVGLNRSSIANLEAGRQNIRLSFLAAIAAALDCPLAVLFGEADLPAPLIEIRVRHEVHCAACGPVAETGSHQDAEGHRITHLIDHAGGAGETQEEGPQ